MPWKIVNLEYSDRSHLHLKDPKAPIHLRTFFADQRVEIGLGAEDPEECSVRATVTSEDVTVHATQFEPLDVQILSSILASLDVEPGERDAALAWMHERMGPQGNTGGRGTIFPGNVAAFPRPSGWPYDLTNEALLESLDDREGAPKTRLQALLREARRRGLRADADPPTQGPEVFHRRPRR
jgi:hypothetical protein